MLIAFDVDGTLINENDEPREEIIALLKALSKDNKIVIWSGGGLQYAERWGARLKLDNHVWSYWYKKAGEVDIAIDDQNVRLGKHNIKV